MKRSILSFILILIGGVFAICQTPQTTIYRDSFKAWRPQDVVIIDSDKLLILGSDYTFSPPYAGLPTDGEACYGNILLLLDSLGNELDRTFISNQYLFSNAEVPARFIHKVSEEKVFLPFYTISAIDSCAVFNMARGLAEISVKSNKLEMQTEIYSKTDDYCSRPEYHGSAIPQKDSDFENLLVTIDLDAKFNWSIPGSYRMTFYDLERNRLKEASIEKDWFAISQNRRTAFFRDSSIFLVGLNKENIEGAAFLEVSENGDSINFYQNLDEPFLSGVILHRDENEIFVEGINWDKEEQYILKYDYDFNLLKKVTIDGRLRPLELSFAKLSDGSFLVAHDQNRISHFSESGDMIATKKYTDWFKKVILLDDENFLVLGEVALPFAESEIGDPYFKIFTLKDKVSNLPKTTNAVEIESAEFQIFPNPVNEILYLKNESQVKIIEIYSLNGRKVQSYRGNHNQIDISHLNTGIYFIALKEEDGKVKMARFVKG